MTRIKPLILGMALAWPGMALADQRNPDAPPGADPAAYRVLIERDIFDRNRGAPPRQVERPAPQQVERPAPPPPAPGTNLALRGAVVGDVANYAVIEDTQSGQTRRVYEGEQIAEATITRVTLAQIELERDQQTVHVPLGYTLAGTPAASASTTASTSGSGSGAAGGSSSVLERMRQQAARARGEAPPPSSPSSADAESVAVSRQDAAATDDYDEPSRGFVVEREPDPEHEPDRRPPDVDDVHRGLFPVNGLPDPAADDAMDQQPPGFPDDDRMDNGPAADDGEMIHDNEP